MLVDISHINYNTKVYFRLWSFGMCPHRTEPWILRQQLPSKHWYLWARLHYITVWKTEHLTVNLYDWLTVHRSITLVDLQLEAQNSYLFTYNTFIKILYMFRALPRSSSRGLRCNCIYAASGIITLCRWLSCAPVNRCTGQSKTSRVMLETCRGF
jgi:hypothetical protein